MLPWLLASAGLVLADSEDRRLLRDAPIAAQGASLYLDSSPTSVWTATSTAAESPDTIPATVPGDIISDLYNAKRIANPLVDLNFKNHSLWTQDWTYATEFPLPSNGSEAGAAASGSGMVLVLDGIKMGAVVTLNGHELGTASDQFLRYEFPVGALLQSTNRLTVEFKQDIRCTGRWMACTGGWDW